MKKKNLLSLMAILALTGAFLTACESKAENAAEDVGEAVHDATH